jgi:hypothetical protein
MKTKSSITLLLGGLLLLTLRQAHATTILHDDMSSLTPWTRSNTGNNAPTLTTVGTDSAIKLANSTVYETLPSTITGDWSLNVKLESTTASRIQTVGLFDSTGTYGYCFSWSSGSSASSLKMLVYDVSNTSGGYTTYTAGTTSNYVARTTTDYAVTASGTDALHNVTFSWNSSAATLSLYFDGALLTTYKPSSSYIYDSFSRVYLSGNTSGVFSDVLVSDVAGVVPEPSSIALVGLAALVLIVIRKKVYTALC